MVNNQNSDLPQEFTESYGTGVHDVHSVGVEEEDAAAAMDGDEAVGGTVSVPDHDLVDELGEAVGLEMSDRAFLRTTEILEDRDDRRWELDPMSSEDYEEHQP
jgi:Family of unknown function (DUF6335)